jgi:hypothetical protein
MPRHPYGAEGCYRTGAREGHRPAREPERAAPRVYRIHPESGSLDRCAGRGVGPAPGERAQGARQAQRDCPALWVRRLDEVRPGLDAAAAKIVVNAMLTMVDNVPRTGRLGERTDVAARLTDLGTALFLDEGHPPRSEHRRFTGPCALQGMLTEAELGTRDIDGTGCPADGDARAAGCRSAHGSERPGRPSVPPSPWLIRTGHRGGSAHPDG